MFSIGEEVWLARCTSTEKWIKCPDCCGNKFLTVILGDDTPVTVDCSECERGYLGPQGVIRSYDYEAQTVLCEINGVSKKPYGDDHIEYSLSPYYHDGEENIFTSEEDAMVRATAMLQQQRDAEAKKIASKDKPNKSWARNATYHRGCVRRAEKDLTYHQSKLTVALKHKKEEKIGTEG